MLRPARSQALTAGRAEPSFCTIQVTSAQTDPWFSHQHYPHYLNPSTFLLFDNGNTRQSVDPLAHSRGQEWKLDERTKIATLVRNLDLGNFSDTLGTANRLPNGNLVFTSGSQGTPPTQFGQSIEVLPDGTQVYVLEVASRIYRSFRLENLYEGVH
jgi:hypothetical protein